MSVKGKAVCWGVALAAVAGVVCLVVVSTRWSSKEVELPLSSGEAMIFLARNGMGFSGPGPFEPAKGLRDSAYLMQHLRLLAGRKLWRLESTNASLTELAIALGHYANRPVILTGDMDESGGTYFGRFESGRFKNRHSAARGIGELLRASGWQVVRVKGGELMLLSEADYEFLLEGRPLVPLPAPPPGDFGERTRRAVEGPAAGEVQFE